MHELEYVVDIIDFRMTKKVDVNKYDLICGFGDIFQQYFEDSTNKKIITIYYGTGMHVCHQNYATLQRIKDVYNKKGKWIGKSSRFVDKTWSHQTTLVDSIIALGNEVCVNSYKKYYDGLVYSLNAPFYQILDARKIIESRDQESAKHYLWFGSSGLIHKGLDLLLDYFSKNKDITLHICGYIENEKEFCRIYKKELFETENIKTYGFVDINSEKFKNILQKCSFVVYPSCSEGGSPSVLATIGNGGLIPIITKETTISTGYEILIDGFDYFSIEKAILKSRELTLAEIKALQLKNLDYVLLHHTQEQYYTLLKETLKQIISVKNEM